MSERRALGVAPATVTGVAVVHCVHDRVKREWTDVDAFTRALKSAGADPARVVVHLCACCQNLFAAVMDDTPRFCQHCEGRQLHPLGGPLPEPKGRVA